MTDPLTEAVARAICQADGQDYDTLSGSYNGRERQRDFHRYAQAATAAMREQLVPQWQPIETAPRDGTSILLLAHGMAIEGRFCPGEWRHSIDGSEYDGPVWSAFDDAVTFEIEETGPLTTDLYHGPVTHWLPLPAAPTGEG